MSIVREINKQLIQFTKEFINQNQIIENCVCQVQQNKDKNTDFKDQFKLLNLNLSIVSKYLLTVKQKSFEKTQMKVIEQLININENMISTNEQNISKNSKQVIIKCYDTIVQELVVNKFSESNQEVNNFNNMIIQKIKQIKGSINTIEFAEIDEDKLNKIKIAFSENIKIILSQNDDTIKIQQLISNLNQVNIIFSQINLDSHSGNMIEYLMFQFYYILIYRNNLILYSPIHQKQIFQRCQDIINKQFYFKQNTLSPIVMDYQSIAMGFNNKLFLNRLSHYYESSISKNLSDYEILNNKIKYGKKILKETLLKLGIIEIEYDLYRKFQYSLRQNKLLKNLFIKQQFQIENISILISKYLKKKNKYNINKQRVSQLDKVNLNNFNNNFISTIKESQKLKKYNGLKPSQSLALEIVKKQIYKLLFFAKTNLRKIKNKQDQGFYKIEMSNIFRKFINNYIKGDIEEYLKKKYILQYSKNNTQQDTFHQKYSLSESVQNQLNILKRSIQFSPKIIDEINNNKSKNLIEEKSDEQMEEMKQQNTQILPFQYSLPKLLFMTDYVNQNKIQIQQKQLTGNFNQFTFENISNEGFKYQRPSSYQQFNQLSVLKKKEFFIQQKWLLIQNLKISLDMYKLNVINNQLNKLQSKQQFYNIRQIEQTLGEQFKKINQISTFYSNQLKNHHREMELKYRFGNLDQNKKLNEIKRQDILIQLNQIQQNKKQQYQYCEQFMNKNQVREKVSQTQGFKKNSFNLKRQIRKVFQGYMRQYFSSYQYSQQLDPKFPIKLIKNKFTQKLEQFQYFTDQLKQKKDKHKIYERFSDNLSSMKKSIDENQIQFTQPMNQTLVTFIKQMQKGNNINQQMNDFYTNLF